MSCPVSSFSLLFGFLWSAVFAGANKAIIPINIVNYYCPMFHVQPSDPISVLYAAVFANCRHIQSPNSLSIIYNGKIVINVFSVHYTVTTIGMNDNYNEIQVIRKPDFVALSEFISEIRNIANIPWLNHVLQCFSDPMSSSCRTVSHFGIGLLGDDNGHLIGINLSHLKLSGALHFESLPQSVRSLDVSFNDLDTLDLDGLRGKSVEKLNVEHNDRCRINDFGWNRRFGGTFPVQILQISSNQMFWWNAGPISLRNCIRDWLRRQEILEEVIVDGVSISRQQSVPLMYTRMLKVIEGVTNKKVIPWYQIFNEELIRPTFEHKWEELGIDYHRRKNTRGRYKFNLRGLGIKGRIDLGALPENALVVDLSNNNISSICFDTQRNESKPRLKELHVQNNDHLVIDLAKIDLSSPSCCLYKAHQFTVSSNQEHEYIQL